MNDFLLIISGIVLLSIGGESLIRGSLSAAHRSNISPLLTGLIIVGFGTSAPELVVSIDAAMSKQPDLAIGNVVGSNIGNILLLLGLCALVYPLSVRPLALRRDALTVLLSSVLFILLAYDGLLTIFDAIIFLLCLAGYLIWAYWSEKYQAAPSADLHKAEAEELSALPSSIPLLLLAIFAGFLLLVGGSKILLIGAVGIAQNFGVSEAVIGLTIVAVGTSLPELTVSLIATLRRHADVAVGNIMGSNIFNVLGILGVSAILQPLPVHSRIVTFDQWVMLVTSLVVFIFLYSGRSLTRLEGGSLLTAYILYIWFSYVVFS